MKWEQRHYKRIERYERRLNEGKIKEIQIISKEEEDVIS
jgi:hypothetical protein